MAKRAQHVAPDNVAMCCVDMFRLFGRGNISVQHITTLLAHHSKAPVKRSQLFNATHDNIVGRNTFAFGHPVATCCDVLGIEKPNQCACPDTTLLHEPGQTSATSCDIHKWWMKILPVSNLSQQHPRYCNMSQQGAQTRATCCDQQCRDMLCRNIAIVPGLDVTESRRQNRPNCTRALGPVTRKPRKLFKPVKP